MVPTKGQDPAGGVFNTFAAAQKCLFCKIIYIFNLIKVLKLERYTNNSTIQVTVSVEHST